MVFRIFIILSVWLKHCLACIAEFVNYIGSIHNITIDTNTRLLSCNLNFYPTFLLGAYYYYC